MNSRTEYLLQAGPAGLIEVDKRDIRILDVRRLSTYQVQ